MRRSTAGRLPSSDGASSVMSDEPSTRSSISEDGEWLFSQLERICSDEGIVSKDDYFSEADGWDMEGLRSDLRLYMKPGSTPLDICLSLIHI